MNKKKVNILLDLMITLFAVAGFAIMLSPNAPSGMLSVDGIENLKFYTVLSNLLCGITAFAEFIMILLNKDRSALTSLKLSSLSAVTITFAVVAFFFGPLYGYPALYQGGNFFYHLVLPLTAIAEFLLVRRPYISFRQAAFSVIPTALYGIFYVANILINGIGQWPDSNDFYGFLNWGYPVGFLIFFIICLLSFAVALIFRKINNRKKDQASSR